MCVNTRLVRNRWTAKTIRVSCGKCEECRQDKALARANRIRCNASSGVMCLFVTLTYKPEFVPYILRSELVDGIEVNIYRDSSVRRYRSNEVVDSRRCLLDTVYVTDKVSFASVPAPKKSPSDYIGVCYYKDVQDFIKRLRINLERDYENEIKFTFYSCSEYGSISKRPHFHLLLFIRPDDEEAVRFAIAKSWLFADRSRTQKYIEVARDAASYVASYVNCGFADDSVLAYDPFRPKHSYSKGFGVSLECFSLGKILEKVRERDLRYNVQRVVDGIPCISHVPIPQYVINRYFPHFKGYSLLTDDEIREFLLRTEELCSLIERKSYLFNFDRVERHEIAVRFSNIFSYFKQTLGWSYERFCIEYPSLYCDVWNLHKSNVLEDSYKIVDDIGFGEFYENANELINGIVHSDLVPDMSYQQDANKRKDIVNRHANMVSLYYKLQKNKSVVNYAMVHSGHNV